MDGTVCCYNNRRTELRARTQSAFLSICVFDMFPIKSIPPEGPLLTKIKCLFFPKFILSESKKKVSLLNPDPTARYCVKIICCTSRYHR